jgi:hypothetical protein
MLNTRSPRDMDVGAPMAGRRMKLPRRKGEGQGLEDGLVSQAGVGCRPARQPTPDQARSEFHRRYMAASMSSERKREETEEEEGMEGGRGSVSRGARPPLSCAMYWRTRGGVLVVGAFSTRQTQATRPSTCTRSKLAYTHAERRHVVKSYHSRPSRTQTCHHHHHHQTTLSLPAAPSPIPMPAPPLLLQPTRTSSPPRATNTTHPSTPYYSS